MDISENESIYDSEEDARDNVDIDAAILNNPGLVQNNSQQRRMDDSDGGTISDSDEEVIAQVGRNDAMAPNVPNLNNPNVVQDFPRQQRMDDSDERTISDSDEEVIAQVGRNDAMALNVPNLNNPNVLQDYPQQQRMDDSDEGNTTDSDDEAIARVNRNDAIAVDEQVMLHSDDEPITDSDEERMDYPNEEPNIHHVEERDVPSDEGSIVDSEEEDDNEGQQEAARQTFVLNVEGGGLDEQLRAANGNVQIYEVLLLFLAKALQHKETYTSMIENFKIINMLFDNSNLPEAMRDFWIILNRHDENFSNQVVCSVCWHIVGEGKIPTRNCRCGLCGPEQTNAHLATYFYVSLRSQIEGLFSKRGTARDLLYPYTRTRHGNDPTDIEDVYDGRHYRHHSAEGGFLHQNNHNYSFAMWADSVSPVETSNLHVLPVFFQILELSPRARQRNFMLAAVYVGPRKPDMGNFLIPVTTELQDLYIHGVNWRPDGGEPRTSRFMTLILSADSEERYKILGMTRHNGRDGCTFCYASGQRIPGAAGNRRVYSELLDRNVADRTDAEIREHAVTAVETGREQSGVRTMSALFPIPVDLRIAQLLETLHCLWEGNFVRGISNVTNTERPQHITPAMLAAISEIMIRIRTPTKLSRYPRDLTQFAKFTGNEYRNVGLFYWLPCAQTFLTAEQLHLFSIFAEFTFTMNKDCIPLRELDRIELLVNEYRMEFQRLFPQEEWVYNVHLLKHAVRSVRDLGPSWVASGFWFESLNRQVVNYITSPTDRSSQVASRILLAQMVDKSLDMPLNPRVRSKLLEYIGKDKWDEQPEVATGEYIRTVGEGVGGLFAEQEIAALAEAGFVNIDRERVRKTKFKALNISGVRYKIPSEQITKYDDSIAHVNAPHCRENVEFIRIQSIINWEYGGEQSGVFGTKFITIGPAFETSYMRIVRRSDDIVYVPQANIITPGVLVEANNAIYISRLPNRWEND